MLLSADQEKRADESEQEEVHSMSEQYKAQSLLKDATQHALTEKFVAKKELKFKVVSRPVKEERKSSKTKHRPNKQSTDSPI